MDPDQAWMAFLTGAFTLAGSFGAVVLEHHLRERRSRKRRTSRARRDEGLPVEESSDGLGVQQPASLAAPQAFSVAPRAPVREAWPTLGNVRPPTRSGLLGHIVLTALLGGIAATVFHPDRGVFGAAHNEGVFFIAWGIAMLVVLWRRVHRSAGFAARSVRFLGDTAVFAVAAGAGIVALHGDARGLEHFARVAGILYVFSFAPGIALFALLSLLGLVVRVVRGV